LSIILDFKIYVVIAADAPPSKVFIIILEGLFVLGTNKDNVLPPLKKNQEVKSINVPNTI